jgi:DNA-binding phage protein
MLDEKNETTVLDIAEYLDSEEIVAEYLNMVSQSDDSALFLRAIRHTARRVLKPFSRC